MAKRFGEMTPLEQRAAIDHAAALLQEELQANAQEIGRVLDEFAKDEMTFSGVQDSPNESGGPRHESTDSYQGWTNRETWALNLWLENDEGLYLTTLERVTERVTEFDADPKPFMSDEHVPAIRAMRAGEAVKDFWEELTDPDEGLMSPNLILQMVHDVGSDYRVNWDEIGQAWLSIIKEG